MRYLLDTNICIYLIKENPVVVLEHFNAIPAGDIGVSSITAAELHYGVEKSQHAEGNRRALEQFLLPQ